MVLLEEKHADQINRILLKARSLKNKGVLLRDPVNRKKLFKKIESSRVFLYKGSKDETFVWL